jgi:hypothetical protein
MVEAVASKHDSHVTLGLRIFCPVYVSPGSMNNRSEISGTQESVQTPRTQ